MKHIKGPHHTNRRYRRTLAKQNRLLRGKGYTRAVKRRRKK